ncbi:g9279 [Coccomyxa elongata]
MEGKNHGRCVRRGGTTVISIMIACSLMMLPVGARILQQSSALVDDGSQDSVSPSDTSSKAPAPAVAALSTSPSPSTTVVRARWASSVTQADDAGADGASPPPGARLSWANQVRALPPAYQAIGAQIVSQTLGPSADVPAADDTNTATAAPETASPNAAAAAPMTAADPPLTVIGDPVPPVATFAPTPVPTLAPGAAAAADAVPAATFAPTPVPTPQPTFAPTRTPAAADVPVATALPAVVPIQAPAPGQAAEGDPGTDTLIVGTALAPQAALAPQPAASSLQCSDNGSGDSVALSICKFITVILPESTRQRMCGRYLPKCPPADPPVAASGMTATAAGADIVPPAGPPAAGPPATSADTPAPGGTVGGPPSIMGMPIPPIGDFLGSLARGLIGGASPTAALTPQPSPPAAAMAG